MPPRKDPLSESDLRQKAYDHGIRFEGSTSPTGWPDNYKQSFKVIHAIQSLQYETYKENQQIPLGRRAEYQKRVRKLRIKVRNLLNDGNPNEASWRAPESLVFAKFEEPIIWYVIIRQIFRDDV